MLSRDAYQQLAAEGYTYIPLSLELDCTERPTDIYLKLAGNGKSYILESASGDALWGRYSFIGVGCRQHIQVRGQQVTLHTDGHEEVFVVEDPLAWIEEYSRGFRIPPAPADWPRFSGGLVGYFGYQTIAYIEPHLVNATANDTLDVPDIFLMVSEQLAVFDNVDNKLLLLSYAHTETGDAYESAQAKLEAMRDQIDQPVPTLAKAGSLPSEKDFVSDFGEKRYMDAVEQCRQYITAGEAMQIVLSQRMQAPFEAPAFSFYNALLELNPSPYMYHLDFESFQIVGSSPEILVRLDDGKINLRPIAGTRRRGRSEEEDQALEQELLNDKKELAEHLMLIDLGRNDVGRIARPGSVEVTEQMVIERYSHVMHMVSNVVGQKREDVDLLDVLRATFPAGTVSGAPKVRAMEIIAQLEPSKRNVYAGAIGYIGWDGAVDTAIAIRTAVIKDDTIYIQTGAGIVYDSNPAHEWMETMNKARGLFKAIEAIE